MSGAPSPRAEGTGPGGPAVRVERIQTPPGGLVEYRPVATLVSLAVGRPRMAEFVTEDGEVHLIEVHPGRVHLFPAGRPIAVRLFAPAENVLVTLSPGVLAEAGGDARRLRLVLAAEAPLVRELVLALEQAASGTERGRRHVRALTAALASQLIHDYALEKVRPGPGIRRLPPPLHTVTRFIEEHVEDTLTLGQLAGLARLSVFCFARRFRTAIGVPPHQYVLQRRVERAKELLRETDSAIAEVALRCGFGDQSAFTTAFRRLTRQTPTGYREAHRVDS